MRAGEMPEFGAEIGARAEIEFGLEKILASPAFGRAALLRRFLEYVVRETLEGRGDRLKEYTLGVAVCQRRADFDPRLDTIVRVTAIKLRQRLHAYYRGKGATDPVSISIPKGSYRPVFQVHDDPPLPILDDPEAIYWQARALQLQFRPDAFARARRLLMIGVARWPNDPRLHTLLAHVIAGATCSYMECIAPDEGVPLMQWAATRALTLDPGRPDAALYANLAGLLQADKTELLAAARRALAAMPQDVGLHNWAAAILLSAGKPSEALLHLRCAIKLLPSVLSSRTFAAGALLYAGRSDEAVRHLRDILECEPDDYAANYWLSRAYCAKRSYDEAKDVAGRAYAASGTAKALSNLGNVEAFAGNKKAVKEIVGKLEEKRAENEYVPRSGLVAIHIAAGELDTAAAEAEAAVQDGDFRLAWIQGDPLWAPLRGRVTGL